MSGLFKDVSIQARGCLHCQRSKFQQHVHSSVPQIPAPAGQFSHTQVDLVGPLPSSRTFHSSLYHYGQDLSVFQGCARVLISCWISRFGVPAKITSDHGAQFTSSLWGVLCSLLTISYSKTTSFHPQSNDLVERFPHSLKTSLHVRLAMPNWFEPLPLVMLDLQTTPQDKTWFSTAKAVYGAPLCLPGEFLDPVDLPHREFLDRIQSALCGLTLPPPHHVAPSSVLVPTALASAEYMFVSKDASIQPLSLLHHVHYRVLSRQDKFFSLETGSRHHTVFID